MGDIEIKSRPPYPTVGEICRLLTGAFDTKSSDPVLSKQLDRLAREGDFDWSLSAKVMEGLVLKPLRGFDPDFSEFVGGFINFLLTEHVQLVSQVSLDAMSREDSLPLLVKELGAGYAAGFLISLRDRFGGPDLGDFMRRDANPIDVVFRWGEGAFGFEISKAVFPDDKQKRDDLARWRRGETIPSFFGSIRPLQRELEWTCSDRKQDVLLFCKWLATARALAWLHRETADAGCGSLIEIVGQQILLNCPTRDVGWELSNANIEAGHRLREVAKYGGYLLNGRLTRTKEKVAGGRNSARQELDRFKGLLDQDDLDGRARYMLDWCEGRWLVLSGEDEKALKYYERACDHALYRAGANQKHILEEALSLAAWLGNKPTLKRFKHRALAMGMFSHRFAELQEKPEVVTNWEIEQFAEAFGKLFPPHGKFPDAPQRPNSHHAFPFRIFSQTDLDKIQADLANPNRVIGLRSSDGRKFRRPQLIWFASEGRLEDVRRLVDAGADVNISDGQGGSALLNALQCAGDGRGREVLDLLLEQPHKKETLDRLTVKKRLSSLYMAVLFGDPEVVEALVGMGANPDLPAGYPPQTSLYLCVERFAIYREGWVERQLMQRIASPGPEDSEIHRRYSGGLSGVMGDQVPMGGSASPRYIEIMRELAKYYDEKSARVPRENYLRIAKILLDHGADPNRKHSSPGPGRTPLMVAAENDAEDVFRIMVDAGGDPGLEDDQGNNCHAIARHFGSYNVLELLA